MRRIYIRHNLLKTSAAAVFFLLLSVVMLTGCSAGSGAETKVTEDLESMRYVELDPDVESEISGILSDKGKAYFELFLSKAGEFDYKITDSRKAKASDIKTSDPAVKAASEVTVVTVRISTYDFASEYLRSWSDYLERSDAEQAESGSGKEKEFDEAELYEELFRNLSNVKDKDHISDIEINCIQDPEGNWQTDALSSAALKDAILGGMLNEIAGLAEAGMK